MMEPWKAYQQPAARPGQESEDRISGDPLRVRVTAERPLEVDVTDERLPGETDEQYRARLAGSPAAPQGVQQDGPWMDFMRGEMGLEAEPEEESDWMNSLEGMKIHVPGGVLPLDEYARTAVGMAQGAGHVFDNAANLMEGAYNNTLGRVFGQSESADTPAFTNLTDRMGRGTEAGQTAGEIGASLFLTRGMGGPAAQGMGAGALMSEADTPLEFARDVAIGGVGGKVGDLAVRGAARAISPVVDEGAKLLHGAKVRLTPGQAIPALRELEEKAQSWPFVGSMITRARRDSFEDFSRAAINDAIEPVLGKGLPSSVKTGHDAVRYAGDKLSAEYEKLVPTLTLRPDTQLINDVQAIGARLGGPEFTPATRRRFEAMVRDGVMSRFKGTAATGAEYRAADKYLSAQAARFGRSAEPDNQAMAEAFRDLQGSLSSALARSNPAQAARLEAINRGWGLLVPAETAAAQAKRGIFSPEQYRTAIRQGDKRVRRRGMARGEARGQELAEAGSEILPTQYPNPSGTAGHEAYSLANMRFWQGLAARPVYNALGRPLVAAALAPRPAFAQPVAEGLEGLPASQLGALLGLQQANALLPSGN